MRELAFTLVGLLLVACGENQTVPVRDPAQPSDPAVLSCIPNLDGVLEAAELGVAYGTPVQYIVSPPGASRAVDLVGTTTDGVFAWDLSIDYADDQAFSISPTPVAERWYAGSFPPDAFVTPFDPGGRIESVGRVTAGAVELLGLASRDEAPPEGKTLLVYSTPIQALAFPIAPGQDFVSTGTVTNGLFQGLPYAGEDTYQVEVDALGSLDLPSLGFSQVHRVKTHVTVQPAVGAASSRRQVSFFFECFGEVARATSAAGETVDLFSTAAELRRLGF